LSLKKTAILIKKSILVVVKNGFFNYRRYSKFTFLFLFLPGVIFCSLPLPLSLEFYSGYREDQFSFKLTSNTEVERLIYREKFDHPRYLVTGISLTTINNGFYFFTDFSYSPLLTHKMHLTDSDLDLKYYTFNHKVKGYDIGTFGELGIAANLTPDRIYQFYIIPLGGYSAYWKAYKRLGINDEIDLQSDSKIEAKSYLGNRKLKEVWYGPYVGGKIFMVPNDFVSFDLAYHFNWIKLKIKFFSILEIINSNLNDNLIFDEFLTKEIDDTFCHGHSHFAEAKVTFNTSKRIKLALFGRYNYYLLDKEKGILKISHEENSMIKEQNSISKLFSRWWSLTGSLELIYQF
jgi:hypothetical protein